MSSLLRSIVSSLPCLVACLWLLAGCAKEQPVAPTGVEVPVVMKAQGDGGTGSGAAATGGDGGAVGGEDPQISDDGDDMGDSDRSGKKRPRS